MWKIRFRIFFIFICLVILLSDCKVSLICFVIIVILSVFKLIRFVRSLDIWVSNCWWWVCVRVGVLEKVYVFFIMLFKYVKSWLRFDLEDIEILKNFKLELIIVLWELEVLRFVLLVISVFCGLCVFLNRLMSLIF